MKAEIISVGKGVLLGQVINTNAAYLSREFTFLGIEIQYHTTVGNHSVRLKEAIKQAETRADIIILSGGLGPAKDDVTKKVVSEYLDIELVLHHESEDKMITFHKNSNFKMPENSQLQALILKDSIPLTNDSGLAEGMYLEEKDHTYILLPGPTDELQPMFNNHLKRIIVDNLVDEKALVSRVFRFFGIAKEELTDKLDNLIENQKKIAMVVYAEKGEVSVHLSVKEDTVDKCNEQLDKVEEEIKDQAGIYFFGSGEKHLPDVVKDLLVHQEKTITAAESLTGGAFLSSLSSDLSAGAIFEGGVVTYSADKKNHILGVSKKIIKKYGVVSPECAIEMAEKAKEMFNSDLAISLTGVAGPSALEGNIPGTVWIGMASKSGKSFAKHYHFVYKRNRNRDLAVLNALELVRRILLDLPIEETVGYGVD